MLIDPYQQLWKPANLWVYAQPCPDVGSLQPPTKEARREPAPIWKGDYHATLSLLVTAGQ